jgi:hypothetical protein
MKLTAHKVAQSSVVGGGVMLTDPDGLAWGQIIITGFMHPISSDQRAKIADAIMKALKDGVEV